MPFTQLFPEPYQNLIEKSFMAIIINVYSTKSINYQKLLFLLTTPTEVTPVKLL